MPDPQSENDNSESWNAEDISLTIVQLKNEMPTDVL